MDADEILARQLQEEEDHAVAVSFQSQESASQGGEALTALREFVGRLESAVQTVLQYESELLQAQALSVIPVDQLQGAAEEAAAISARMQEQPPLAVEDALARELLLWFKTSFFHWVSSPPCSACGSDATTMAGMVGPSADERAGGASRVEHFSCSSCRSFTRFPRYNDPGRLLETRRGRCGEWANCFTLCCRAMGLDSRYVADWTDHVWTEYYSTALGRWIHMDPCEAAYDKPLLYEVGWGKALNYAVGVSKDGVCDVTRRYTTDVHSLQRVLVPEEWLKSACIMLTGRLRAELSQDERIRLQQRDAADLLELEASPASVSDAAAAHMPGRQTGSASWRAARGEYGTRRSERQKGTRWRFIKSGQLKGALVRASGENEPGETADKAFQEETVSKWLDFGAAGGAPSWLEITLLEPRCVTGYSLTSADDAPERDPCDFTLEAVLVHASQPAEGPPGESPEHLEWIVLDAREGHHFAARLQSHSFKVQKAPYCSRLRLTVTRVRNPAVANSMQLCQLALSLADRETSTEMQSRSGVTTQNVESIAEVVEGISISEPIQQTTDCAPRFVGETVARLDPAAVQAAFALKLRHEFDKIMAAGGSSPAEAAAAALKLLRVTGTS